MKVIWISLLFFFTTALSTAQAQSQSTFKRTTATILFASIGGGVLGLSTLSFYGRPQEHTDNITTGVLIGFLAGLSFVVYDSYALQNASAEPLSTTQKQLLAVNAEYKSLKSNRFDSKKRGQDFTMPLFNYEISF